MATSQPSNPSSPQGSSSSQQQAKDQLEALKSVLKLQGDYRDILKDATRDLDKTLKNYDRMEAKLASITRSQINIKEIERQIKSTKEQDYLTTKKIADSQKKLSTDQQNATKSYLTDLNKRHALEQSLLKAEKDGNTALATRYAKAVAAADRMIERKEESLNVEQLAYAQALKSEELNKEVLNKQQQQLKFENDLRKNVGFTGAAFKFMADKIGVGGSYMEDMVEEARKLNEQGKKLTFVDKIKLLGQASLGALAEVFKDPAAFAVAWKAVSAGFDKLGGAFAKAGGAVKGLSSDSSDVVTKLASPISGLVKNIPLVGGLLAGMVDGFAAVLDLIVGVDHTIVKAGRNLGMTSDQARQLNRHFQDVSYNTGNIFVTSKKLLESYVELAGQLEVNNRLSDEALQTDIMLKKFAGLELETRAKIVEVSKISGKSSEGVVKSVLAQVKGLEKATGIQFNYQKILKEVSSLSGVLGLNFSKYPAQLTKSYLTIKAMGMDMKQLDSMADGFLDVESSIAKEMEAQVLTGRDINLNKARELFLNNDLAGAAAEINRQVGSSADFLNMNRIAAESFAQSMGMSRDQLADMLQKQELYSRLGAKGTENAREMYQLALKKYGTEKAIADAMGDQAFQSMQQASTQEKLMEFIEKIKQSVVDFIERSGIIEKVEKFVNMLSDPSTIRGIIKWVKDAIAGAIEMVSGLIGDIFEVVAELPFTDEDKWMERAQFFKEGGISMANRVRSVGSDFGGTASVGDNAIRAQTAGTSAAAAPAAPQGFGGARPIVVHSTVQVEKKTIGTASSEVNQEYAKIDKQRVGNPYGILS